MTTANTGFPVAGGDLPAKNTSIITIPAGAGVVFDVAVLPSGDVGLTCTVPLVSGSVAKPMGIAIENIGVGKTGRVRMLGGYTMTASGTVTYGDAVQIDSASSKMGFAKTCGAATAQLGRAMNTATDGNPVMVWVGGAPVNA